MESAWYAQHRYFHEKNCSVKWYDWKKKKIYEAAEREIELTGQVMFDW